MVIVREARVEHLPDIVAYVAKASRSAVDDEEVQFAVRLAVEELFMNIVRHGYPDGPGPVTVSVSTSPGAVTITVQDEGRAFDPTAAPAPDVESGWEERPLGGLGWHLVRQFVDEIRHSPGNGGGNVVTLVKHLPDGRPNVE